MQAVIDTGLTPALSPAGETWRNGQVLRKSLFWGINIHSDPIMTYSIKSGSACISVRIADLFLFYNNVIGHLSAPAACKHVYGIQYGHPARAVIRGAKRGERQAAG